MGQYSPKNDQDTRDDIKIGISRNDVFCLKIMFFEAKIDIFQNWNV